MNKYKLQIVLPHGEVWNISFNRQPNKTFQSVIITLTEEGGAVYGPALLKQQIEEPVPVPEEVVLLPTSLQVQSGDSYTFIKPTVYDNFGDEFPSTDSDFTWYSDLGEFNGSTILFESSVDIAGVVEVTHTSSGLKDSCTVTIKAAEPPPPPPIELDLQIIATDRFEGAGDYSVDVFVRDNLGVLQVGVDVIMEVSGGTFGPGTTIETRTTNTDGYVRINWSQMADGDTFTATCANAEPAVFTHKVAAPPPPPPPPPPPTGPVITITDGDDQTSVVGTTLSKRLAVKVTDENNLPLMGVTVTFNVTAGGGFVTPVTKTTGELGLATTSWTLGPVIGTQTVTASIPNITPVTFTATATDVNLPPPPPPPGGANKTPQGLRKALGTLSLRSSNEINPIPAIDAKLASTEFGIWNQYFSNPDVMYLLANHYGGLKSRIQWCIRNNLPYGPLVANDLNSFYGRGVHIIKKYLQMIAIPNKFAIPPHNNTGMPDMEVYYLLEGDINAKNHLHIIAISGSTDRNNYLRGGNTGSDVRQVYVTLQGFSSCHRLNIPYQNNPINNQAFVDTTMGSWVDVGTRQIKWLTDNLPHPFGAGPWVQPNGAIPSPAHSNQEAYLFNAGLAVELFKWWGFVDNSNLGAKDLAILIMQHLVSEWERYGRQPLPYLSNSAPGAANELAGFHVEPALIAWQETNDQKFYDFALAHMQATLTGYIGQPKQWNQVFSTGIQNAGALVLGVPWK